MSYILDALRKSEEERTKSGGQPTRSGYTFIKDSPKAKRNKFLFGLILTSLMLLVIVILGAGWWWSKQEQADSGVAATPAPPVDAKAKTPTEAAPAPAAQIPLEEPAPVINDEISMPELPVGSTLEIPYLEDMSGEFQQRLPELKFSGHVYSDEPALRMIMINDAVARQGDPIKADLVLDEITADGVILRLEQNRFQIKLF